MDARMSNKYISSNSKKKYHLHSKSHLLSSEQQGWWHKDVQYMKNAWEQIIALFKDLSILITKIDNYKKFSISKTRAKDADWYAVNQVH